MKNKTDTVPACSTLHSKSDEHNTDFFYFFEVAAETRIRFGKL